MSDRPGVVVTGAAGGIGRAVVARLATDWDVVAVDRSDEVFTLAGPHVTTLTGDVSDRTTHERAAAMTRNLRGWVNNAAVQLPGSAGTVTEADARRQLEVNVLGTMWGCTAAVGGMASGGAIVSISSIHAVLGFTGAFAYAATKGAVVALARQVAVEYGPRGIRSNSVLPGAIDTPMCSQEWASATDPAAARAADEGLHLMHRMGTPDEVAAVVAFLLADDSSLINGQQIIADGGATARPPL